MLRNYIVLILFFFAGCKEVYDPDIENDKTVLTFQGLMTNNQGELSVIINAAAPFDSTTNRIPVRGATVSVSDDLGNIFKLFENNNGTYENPGVVAEAGRTYHLKVVTSQGDIYESGPQTIPEVFDQDSIYANVVTRSVFTPTSYGDFIKSDVKGIETYVDLSSKNNDFPKCRYESKVTVLYVYISSLGFPPPTVYCWKTFNPNTIFNLTSTRFDKTVANIPKHSISFFVNNISYYDDRRSDYSVAGWLLSVNKYNMSAETHQYYLNIKKQLEASGKIFDPIPSQIFGNMKCTNHPEKLAFGFFEVSNNQKLYYRYDYAPKGYILTPKDKFTDLSNEGENIGIPPPFWYN